MQNKLSRKNKYWLCQFLGWGFYASVYIIFGFNPEKSVLLRVILSFALFVLQFFGTELYRNIIIRNKWLDKPIRSSALPIIISSVALSLIIESIFLTLTNIASAKELEHIPVNRLIVGYMNRSFVNFAWSVIYFAVNYFENYNKEKIEKLWYEMMLKDSELQLLKSQMHPHFIFNAINNISGLINENPGKAQGALTQLSSLLRYSLNANKKETVTLEEEMQIVNDYLELESIRFEERLKVTADIGKDTLGAHIPPLMIQTLCENCIKHGISKLPQGGVIQIKTLIDSNNLVISILNSGILLESNKEGDSYGLKDTRQRLSLLYDDEATLELKSVSNNLVLSEVKIPLRMIYEYSDC